MTQIPEHCIVKFEKDHGSYPSILEMIPIHNKELLNKFFSKSRVIWRNEITNDIRTRTIHKLIDYDPSGVMVYINEEINIFILTTESRLDVAKLTLTRLKKLNQDGNNSGTTKTEN